MVEILPIGKGPVENPGSRRKGDWGVDRSPKNDSRGEKNKAKVNTPQISQETIKQLDIQMD
ncbi:MAG TPA: hypothetical protein VF189_01445 [Patescibacteria group bacterium]